MKDFTITGTALLYNPQTEQTSLTLQLILQAGALMYA